MEQRRFPPRIIPRKKPEVEESNKKCKITVKRRKDGTLVKEISGECTAQQLKALSDQQINLNERGENEST